MSHVQIKKQESEKRFKTECYVHIFVQFLDEIALKSDFVSIDHLPVAIGSFSNN